MTLRNDRGGFALPMVILVIGFMTAGVLAGFARTGAEVQLLDSQSLQTSAFSVAEAGLERFLAARDTVAARYDFAGDSAYVTATLMRPAAVPTDTAIYLIRSVGVVKGGVGRPAAKRTVAQLAYRIGGTMQVLSSWTSLSGLRKAGASGTMTGNDACSDDVLPGVAVPDGRFTGQDAAISGDPPIVEMGDQDEMADQIDINWVEISNASNPAIDANRIICLSGTGYDPNWSPCGSWPSSTAWLNPDFWPVIVVNGSGNLPGNGRGTLIVTGNLTLRGGDRWDGIVLVGGTITDNGNGAIGGAVVSGLNVLKGWEVDESSRANGTKSYTYDSCKVASAANAQTRLVQVSNAWVDNWMVW